MLIVSGLPLQDPSPAPTPRIIDESTVSAGPIALLIIVVLAVSLILLIRNMNKQMRRIDFDQAGLTDEERMHRSGDGPGGDEDQGPPTAEQPPVR